MRKKKKKSSTALMELTVKLYKFTLPKVLQFHMKVKLYKI